MSFEMKGDIYGGPHDGESFVFKGDGDKDDILDKMKFIVIHGQKYELTNLNRETLHVNAIFC